MTAQRLAGSGMSPLMAKTVVESATTAAPVTSVNGAVGVVVLDAGDVGAVPAETAATYSEVAADIAAVLVAHGMMEPEV